MQCSHNTKTTSYVGPSCYDAVDSRSCSDTSLTGLYFSGPIYTAFSQRSQGYEHVVHGPDRVTVHPPQDSLRPSFYCSLDLPGYQKSMPSKKSWDGLPVLGHFQNGRHRNLEITFCAIT